METSKAKSQCLLDKIHSWRTDAHSTVFSLIFPRLYVRRLAMYTLPAGKLASNENPRTDFLRALNSCSSTAMGPYIEV